MATATERTVWALSEVPRTVSSVSRCGGGGLLAHEAGLPHNTPAPQSYCGLRQGPYSQPNA